MSCGPTSMPDQQRRHARGDDAEGRVAQEVEEPLRLGVLEQLVEEEEHVGVRQCPRKPPLPVSASTTRSSRMPRLPFTRTTSPGRSCGRSQSSSGSTSRKCAGSTPGSRRAVQPALRARAEEGHQRRPPAHAARPARRAPPARPGPSSSMSPSTATARPPGGRACAACPAPRPSTPGWRCSSRPPPSRRPAASTHVAAAARRAAPPRAPGRTPRASSRARAPGRTPPVGVQRVVLADEAAARTGQLRPRSVSMTRARPLRPRGVDLHAAARRAPAARPKVEHAAPRAALACRDDRAGRPGSPPPSARRRAARRRARPRRPPRPRCCRSPSRCSGWTMVMSAASGLGRCAVSRVDLARVVHPQLDHRRDVLGLEAEQRERHAHLVVEVALGLQRRAARRRGWRPPSPWWWSCRCEPPTAPTGSVKRRRWKRASAPERLQRVLHLVEREAAGQRRQRGCPRCTTAAAAPRRGDVGEEGVRVEALALERDEQRSPAVSVAGVGADAVVGAASAAARRRAPVAATTCSSDEPTARRPSRERVRRRRRFASAVAAPRPRRRRAASRSPTIW